jgi:predicted HicB family RNase H-like nuclease
MVENKSIRVAFRVSPRVKRAIVKAARSRNVRLSTFLRGAVFQAIGTGR